MANSALITLSVNSTLMSTLPSAKCSLVCQVTWRAIMVRSSSSQERNTPRTSTIPSCERSMPSSVPFASLSPTTPLVNWTSEDQLSGWSPWWFYSKTHTLLFPDSFSSIQCSFASPSPPSFAGPDSTDFKTRASPSSGLHGFSSQVSVLAVSAVSSGLVFSAPLLLVFTLLKIFGTSLVTSRCLWYVLAD